MQVQESQRTPSNMNAKRPTLRHIVIKMPEVKDKESILKAAREKKLVTYRGIPMKSNEEQGPRVKTALFSKAII